jgi:hypothetical protein
MEIVPGTEGGDELQSVGGTYSKKRRHGRGCLVRLVPCVWHRSAKDAIFIDTRSVMMQRVPHTSVLRVGGWCCFVPKGLKCYYACGELHFLTFSFAGSCRRKRGVRHPSNDCSLAIG